MWNISGVAAGMVKEILLIQRAWVLECFSRSLLTDRIGLVWQRVSVTHYANIMIFEVQHINTSATTCSSIELVVFYYPSACFTYSTVLTSSTASLRKSTKSSLPTPIPPPTPYSHTSSYSLLPYLRLLPTPIPPPTPYSHTSSCSYLHVHMADSDDEQYWQQHDSLVQIAVQGVALIAVQSLEKIPCRTSPLSGHAYLKELLAGNPQHVFKVLWMSTATFQELCDWLQNNTSLKPSRNVSLDEWIYTPMSSYL